MALRQLLQVGFAQEQMRVALPVACTDSAAIRMPTNPCSMCLYAAGRLVSSNAAVTYCGTIVVLSSAQA